MTLCRRQFLSDQAQSIATLALTDLAFNSIALPLIIKELSPLGCHQLRIILRAAKTRTTQPNTMTLAECTISSCAVNLIGADDFRMAAVLTTICLGLDFQIFPFVVGVKAQPIQESKSFTGDRK